MVNMSGKVSGSVLLMAWVLAVEKTVLFFLDSTGGGDVSCHDRTIHSFNYIE